MKTQPAEMTAEEKRIKIAIACGWKAVYRASEVASEFDSGTFDEMQPVGEHPKGGYGYLPNYFESLDACAEMEKTLEEKGLCIEYVAHLAKLPSGKDASRYGLVHASAAHRAECFGKTLNLW